MKITEALRILQSANAPSAPASTFFLACGFTPLHLATLLGAHLQGQLPDRRIQVQTGLYGDLPGNLGLIAKGDHEGAAVVFEWGDFDQRLGLRDLGGWQPAELPDVIATSAFRVEHFLETLERVSARLPIAACLPTLPVPPAAYTPGWMQSDLSAELRRLMANFGAKLSRLARVRVVDPQRTEALSPLATRLDVKSYLTTGFPYRVAHASVLADLLVRLLKPPAAKKGVITDLDNTLWLGILGEDGLDGVSWDLDHKSHMHGLYQQLLRSLAGAGVLIAAASRADQSTVEAGLQSADLLLPKDCLFPVEANWEPKSYSVGRILRTWGVGAESVVFVDDSPTELAEVQAAYPEIECLNFPTGDENGIYALLEKLRDLCGKPLLSEEDRLRLATVRTAATLAEPLAHTGERQEAFLAQADQELSVVSLGTVADPRALELVNKTNQFNLNGRRYTEGQWLAFLAREDARAFLVSYRDKYGSLGKISVLAGRLAGATLHVDTWVLSCRAFSRRIEYAVLDHLFDVLDLDAMVFDYQPTPKNHLVRDFLAAFVSDEPDAASRIPRSVFTEKRPRLFFRSPALEPQWTVSKAN